MLKIQEFLINGGTIEQLTEQYGIKCGRSKEYPNLALFKYDQIESPMSEAIVQEARGIVLDENDNWRVVGRGFSKFFNHLEGNAAQIDWSTAKVQEKVDGCCDEDTLIKTPDGMRSIKELCDTKYTGLVWSYDPVAQLAEWDNVVAQSALDNNNDWYLIEFDDGSTIKLTGNHRVYLPEMDCYRCVSELKGEERVLQ